MRSDQAQNNAAPAGAVQNTSGENHPAHSPKVHVKNIAQDDAVVREFVLLYEAGKIRELDEPQAMDEQAIHALNSMSDVLAAQLRRQHSDHASKQFDFSPLIGSLNKYADSDDVAVMLNLSKSGAGRLFALQSDKVNIGYDGTRGLIHVTGEKADVMAFLGEVYFFGNVRALAHFTIDVHVLPGNIGGDFSLISSSQAADSEALLSQRLIMFYEPSSGFYVAYQGSGSRGAVPVESNLVNVTTPDGAFIQFSPRAFEVNAHALRDVFNAAQQSTQVSGTRNGNFDLDPDNLLASVRNDPPIANDDNFTVSTNTALTIAAFGVPGALLANDSDPNGNALSILDIDSASANGGTITDNGDGTFTFTPAALFVGNDSFSYVISDGKLTNTATVNISVVNASPIAANDSYNTTINNLFVIDATNGLTGLLDNDSDPEMGAINIASIAAVSANGGTIVDNMDGTFTYTPPNFFIGSDSFSYSVSDGISSSTGTVTFAIPENLVLTAALNDILIASATNAAFTGTSPNWHISDSVIGGAGADMLTITAGLANADLDINYTNISSVESFVFNANAAHNLIFGDTYFDRANALNGNILTVQTSSNVGVVFDGSSIADATHRLTLVAGTGNNTLRGGLGNDTVTASGGDDIIEAGAGDNLVNAGDGNNNIQSLTGNDSITAGTGNDTISSGSGNDSIAAGDGNNSVTAGNGNDTITSGSGDDTIIGGSGIDSIQSGAGNDSVDAGNGDDYIDVAAGNDRVNAGAGNDVIRFEPTVAGSAGTLVSGNLIFNLDASNTGSLTLAGSTVTNWNDLSTANNDAFADTGTPQSGGDIGGLNAIQFGGADFLQITNNNNINLQAESARSIFAAFETGADINTRQVIYEQGGQTNGYAIYIFNGDLYLGIWRDNATTINIYDNVNIAPNTSYVAGLVYDNVITNSFTTYLNGTQLNTTPVAVDQNPHSGGIALGGANGDTRHESGGFSGDGLGFSGEIGQILNYNDALTAPEVTQVSDFLGDKWGAFNVSPDNIDGGTGNDTLYVDGANPYLETLTAGGATVGIEHIDLRSNNSAHEIRVESDYFTAIDGDLLTIDATGISTGIRVIGTSVGVAGRVSLMGGDGDDTLQSGAGNDTITASLGDDNVQGGGGNDSIVAGAGNDSIDGGVGTDLLDYSGSAAPINANLATGVVTGSGTDSVQNIEQLIGSNFNDTILGSSFSETLVGGAGDDEITGADSFPAGAFTTGNLVARLDAANTASITNSSGNVTLWNDQSTRNHDAVNDVGNVVSGSSTINGLNSLQFNGASHLGIADTNDINTTAHAEFSVFVTFETGADVATRQVVYEQGGNVNGFNIYIEGGDLYVGAWTNTGGTLRLFLNTSISANETYSAGFVFDHATTQTFTGYLNGVAFDNTPTTANHSSHTGDIGIGAVNNASFFDSTGAEGGDAIADFTGEIGELLIYNDALTAPEATSTSNYLLNKWHSGDADSLDGGAGNDTLIGGGANDTINGGADDDRISGRFGADVLAGGTGNDTFVYDDMRDSGVGAANRDVISDFVSGVDKIDISTIGGFVAASANGAGGGIADFTGAAGQAVWGQSGADMIIFLDQDGDGAADAEIQLTGISAMQASDFVF